MTRTEEKRFWNLFVSRSDFNYQGFVYGSKNYIPSPQKMISPPLSTFAIVYSPRAPFLDLFCHFCVYCTLWTSIPLIFYFPPYSLYLSTFLIFFNIFHFLLIFSPKNDIGCYPPVVGGGGAFSDIGAVYTSVIYPPGSGSKRLKLTLRLVNNSIWLSTIKYFNIYLQYPRKKLRHHWIKFLKFSFLSFVSWQKKSQLNRRSWSWVNIVST